MAATDWIKVRTNLKGDPHIHGVCDRLDISVATVVGALVILWSEADSQTANGFLPSMSLKAVDRMTGVPGFGDTLKAVGWLEVSDGGVTIARFEDHNGESAKKRAQNAVKQAKHRGRNPADAPGVTGGGERNPEVVTNVTDGGNDPVTKKEKENKTKDKDKTLVGKNPDDADSQPEEIESAVKAEHGYMQSGLPGMDSLPVEPPSAEASASEVAIEILTYLNAKTGSAFEPVDANLNRIRARLAQSTPDKVRAVIDAKVVEWSGPTAKPGMAKYLRPATLFAAENFAQYVGQLGARVPPQTAASKSRFDLSGMDYTPRTDGLPF